MDIDVPASMTRCSDASESVPMFVNFSVGHDRADTRWRRIRHS